MGISWKFGFFGFWDIFAKRPEVVPSLSQPWVGFPRYQAWQQSPSPRVPLRSVALGCRSHPRPARCAHAPPSGTERIGSATQKRKSRWFQNPNHKADFGNLQILKNLQKRTFMIWVSQNGLDFPVSHWFPHGFFFMVFCYVVFYPPSYCFQVDQEVPWFPSFEILPTAREHFWPWTTGQGYTCYMKL